MVISHISDEMQVMEMGVWLILLLSRCASNTKVKTPNSL